MARKEHKDIQKTLEKNHACYVLITCDEPTPDGSMQVKMSYSGDPNTASFLLQGAQSYIDIDVEEEQAPKTALASNKVYPF